MELVLEFLEATRTWRGRVRSRSVDMHHDGKQELT